MNGWKSERVAQLVREHGEELVPAARLVAEPGVRLLEPRLRFPLRREVVDREEDEDITVSNGAPAPYTMMSEYMHGKEGALCTVNGQVNPRLDVYPGQVFRLRVLNVSNARFYRLSLQGCGGSAKSLDRTKSSWTVAASKMMSSPPLCLRASNRRKRSTTAAMRRARPWA